MCGYVLKCTLSPLNQYFLRSDISLFSFLEHYMKRLEGPLAVQVWGKFMQLAKDLATSMREFRVQAFAALRYEPLQLQTFIEDMYNK